MEHWKLSQRTLSQCDRFVRDFQQYFYRCTPRQIQDSSERLWPMSLNLSRHSSHEFFGFRCGSAPQVGNARRKTATKTRNRELMWSNRYVRTHRLVFIIIHYIQTMFDCFISVEQSENVQKHIFWVLWSILSDFLSYFG